MRARTLWNLIRWVLSGSVFFLVWLFFSSETSLFAHLLGLAGAMLISALTYRVFLADHEAGLRYFFPNPIWVVVLIVRLSWSFYLSSFRIVGTILGGPCRPRIVHFRTRLKSDLARFALANFITWTPGTITLDLDDDHLTVFWFYADTAHRRLAGEKIKEGLEGILGKVWV